MLETIQGNIYDYPKYYDLVYGSDWKAEYDFLLACFDRHVEGAVRKVYEPACGTGRLLVKLAGAGLNVIGADLNRLAVDYCNDRLERSGHARSAVVGDMTTFVPEQPIDAAFNTINSFRHLSTEAQAVDHFRSVANALRPGGIYVLGLHLTPTSVEPMQEESWSARRGNLAVLSRMWVLDCDLRRRQERVGTSFDVYTPSRQFRIEDQITFRTYTHRQMNLLLNDKTDFEITAAYDFGYDMENPIEIGPATEDVVYILTKVS